MLENQLIDKCKLGDGEAFRHLMKIYKTKLFGYLWKFSNSQEMTEELFQETIIKVWKGFRKYNHQEKYSSWLFTIAHNVAMDYIRKNKNVKMFTSLDEIRNVSAPVTPDADLMMKEKIEQINKSVHNLSDKQKRVFLLRQHGELSFKEIAKATNEPLNTVLSHMRYAVKKIKKQIEKENESRKRTIA